MKLLGTLILVVALVACSASSTSSGGSGGAEGTSTSSGGSGGSCVEPTPPEWVGPLDPFTPHLSPNRSLTVLPDEAGGLAAIGAKLGPFACAHDLTAVEVMYLTGTWQGYTYAPPATRRATIVRGDPQQNGDPASAPLPLSECSDDCPAPMMEGEFTFYPIPFAEIVHVEPGDIVYPVMQLDSGIGVGMTDEEMVPNPGWYYGPPGSVAGGEAGLWAALDDPPPGIPVYGWAPIVRVREATPAP